MCKGYHDSTFASERDLLRLLDYPGLCTFKISKSKVIALDRVRSLQYCLSNSTSIQPAFCGRQSLIRPPGMALDHSTATKGSSPITSKFLQPNDNLSNSLESYVFPHGKLVRRMKDESKTPLVLSTFNHGPLLDIASYPMKSSKRSCVYATSYEIGVSLCFSYRRVRTDFTASQVLVACGSFSPPTFLHLRGQLCAATSDVIRPDINFRYV